MKTENKKLLLGGFFIGVVNGLLGAGGGMLAVPLLKKSGMSQADSQANSVAVILPLTVVSALLYLATNKVDLTDAVRFIPGGLLGAVIGTSVLYKIPNNILRKIFAVFMLWAGVRMFLR